MIGFFTVALLISSSETVRSISFSGLANLKEKELLSVMLLKKPCVFSKSKFDERILEGDVDAIRSVFIKNGYLFSNITYKYKVDSSGFVDINIFIDEGRRTFVKNVEFRGNVFFDYNTLKKIVKIKEGDPFNPFLLEEDYSNLILIYDNNGYHDVKVNSEIYSPEEEANIVYTIKEGARIFISDIFIEDVGAISRDRLKITIGLEKGSVLTNNKLANSKRRLNELDLFSRIRIVEADSSTNRNLIYKFEPKEPLALRLRIGYSALDRTKLTFMMVNKNFLNSFRNIGLLGRIGLKELGLEVNYRDPITFGKWMENSSGLKFDYKREIGYDIEKFGAYTMLVPRPFYLRYDLERVILYNVEISDLEEESPDLLQKLSVSLMLDRRDDPVKVREGYFVFNSIEFEDMISGVSGSFLKGDFRFNKFSKLGNSTIAFRSNMGVLLPLNQNKDVPIYNRFFLGGSTTIRGYAENRAGPQDEDGNPIGAERYLLSSCELRAHLFANFYGVLFSDIGSMEEDINSKNFNILGCAGVGLRFYTPIGPLRLDFARNFEGESAWHFAIGEAF
jgi:outer membrane protein insertion porin family